MDLTSRSWCSKWLVLLLASCFAGAGCESDELSGVAELLIDMQGAYLPPDYETSGTSSPKWQLFDVLRLEATDGQGQVFNLLENAETRPISVRVIDRPQLAFDVELEEKIPSLRITQLEIEFAAIAKGGGFDSEELDFTLEPVVYTSIDGWQLQKGEDLQWSFSVLWRDTLTPADADSTGRLEPPTLVNSVQVIEE